MARPSIMRQIQLEHTRAFFKSQAQPEFQDFLAQVAKDDQVAAPLLPNPGPATGSP